jgi:hypothetical protein
MTETGVVRVVVGLVLGGGALLAAVVADASHQRAARFRQQTQIDRVAARLPAPALALSGGARWLREPSLEEPGAAFAEGPAVPDPDPADGIMAPPRALWVEGDSEGGKAEP